MIGMIGKCHREQILQNIPYLLVSNNFKFQLNSDVMDPDMDGNGYDRLADARASHHLIADPLAAERNQNGNRPRDGSEVGREQDELQNGKSRPNDGVSFLKRNGP